MILVTGGTGFLGSHLLAHLYGEKKNIRAIKRPNTSFRILSRVCDYYRIPYEDLKSSIEWVEADILDVYSLEDALERKLAPVMDILLDVRDRPAGMTEIIGGIGYIVGLVGIVLYVANRKKRND